MGVLRLVFLSSILTSAHALHILVYLLLVARSHLDFGSSLITKLTERGHTVVTEIIPCERSLLVEDDREATGNNECREGKNGAVEDFVLVRMNSAVPSNGSHDASRVFPIAFDGKSPWNRKKHMIDPFAPQPSEVNLVSTSLDDFNLIAEDFCPLVLQDEEIKKQLSTTKYDLALVSSYDGCPFALAHRHGIDRVVAFSSLPMSHFEESASGIPSLPVYQTDTLHGKANFDSHSFYDRMINFIRIHYRKIVEEGGAFERTDAIVRKYYGSDFPSVESLYKRSFFELANANVLLEQPRITSSRIKMIGGIGFRRGKNITDKFYLDLLARAKRGVVIISFGSQVPAENIPPHVLHAFLHSVCHFPDHEFIFKYNLPLPPSAPSNLHRVDWLPQNDLLQHPRVVAFVSHVGLNSFVEASFSGVPILAIPLFADQIHNGACVRRLGTGVVVSKYNVTDESMLDAMGQLLKDPRYGEKARELAAMLDANPDTPQRTFIEAIEFAAKFKDLDKITYLPGGDFPFWSHYGYDVVLFFYSLLLLGAFISLRLLSLCHSKRSSTKVKKE